MLTKSIAANAVFAIASVFAVSAPAQDAATDDKCPVAKAGTISEFALPAGADAASITFGPDRRVWSTDTANDKIRAANANGAVTEYALAVERARPASRRDPTAG